MTDVTKIRTVFMGSPEFAVPFLSALVEAGFNVRGVVTQPDRPRGRGQETTPVPVKAWAMERNIPARTPSSLRTPEGREFLNEWTPDLIVVVAYGKILPGEILDFPKFGCVNVHASLLPELRGASPIVWAVRRSLSVTGVSLMLLDRGMDTGPVFDRIEIPLLPRETSNSLMRRMAELGPPFMVEGLEGVLSGRLKPIPQPEKGTFAPILRKEDGRIPFELSAREVDAHVRAMNPWPGATSGSSMGTIKVGSGEISRDLAPPSVPGQILSMGPEGIEVACGEGVYRILSLQREGGRMLSAREFLAGKRFGPSEVLVFRSPLPKTHE